MWRKYIGKIVYIHLLYLKNAKKSMCKPSLSKKQNKNVILRHTKLTNEKKSNHWSDTRLNIK